jgi:hypothetical protein
MSDNKEEKKISAYVQAGSPQNCFLPSCRKLFSDHCVHGKDGHFYCCQACAEIGSELDLRRVEDLNAKRSVPIVVVAGPQRG